MKLIELTEAAGSPGSVLQTPVSNPEAGNPEIAGITADSRRVEPGFLFAALRGTARDGREFAGEAAARGAVAILTDDADALKLDAEARRRVAIVVNLNPHRLLALLAARFYGRQPRTIVAVTGTNGKTSVAHFTREIWTALGHPAASLGTLGLVSPSLVSSGGRRPGSLTTPDPVALHRDLAELAGAGIEHVAIEASSHGLAQYRLDGLSISAAAFTNLTRDHLDYHGDMESYRAAKQRLFAELLGTQGCAVLNTDSPEFAALDALCRGRGVEIIRFGHGTGGELRIVERVPLPAGQRLIIEIFGARHDIVLPLVGGFQASNVLAALGLAIATGAAPPQAIATLPGLSGVPGRMQLIGETATGAAVFVDYAHTPDALATVLTALRPHVGRRLAVVFGAGGDRDRGKRPLMGRVASDLADRVYVTDDNPRSENPADIRRAILEAVPGAVEIGDRRQAIGAGIAALERGDILVIAGKGHETGQIIGGTVLPFDDAAVAREALAASGQQ